MATLYRTLAGANVEATELLSRYRVTRTYIIRHERIYGEDKSEPGYETLIGKEMQHEDRKKIVAVVNKRGIRFVP